VGRARLNEGGIRGKIIMRIRIAAAAAAIAALAGCGSSGSHLASPPASPSSTAAPANTAPPPLTCSTGTNDNGMTASQVIRMLVSDQKSQDKALEENWVTVTDGSETSQGNDLDAAAQSLGSYNGTELAADASQFASDVQTFLTDQSGGLLPGWPSEYDAVAADIHRLADDCDMSFPVGGAGGRQGGQ
jgi:hypothetical protein